MSDARADSPAAWQAEPPPQNKNRWSLNRWLIIIALVFAVHVLLLFLFGARKQISARVAAAAPVLRLAGSPDELLALKDPTLFALPRSGDFATVVWLQPPVVTPPMNRLSEPTNWLELSADELMGVFNRFMQTNQVAGVALQLKPPVRLSAPETPVEPALAQQSAMRLEGDLTQRRLLAPVDPPSWPYADVIAPTRVQVLVDEAGDVVSATLLPSDNSLEALNHSDAADQQALELARAARFAPATSLTIGQMIFTWRTVPPPATTAPEDLP